MASLIEIWTEELPPAYQWDPNNFVGGTPEYVVETAGCLKKLGFDVRVYKDGQVGEYGGVYYLPREAYQGLDVVLAVNGRPPHLGRRNIYWTSLAHERDTDFMDFDERIVMSDYHQGIFGPNSKRIYLACWPKNLQAMEKVKGQCLYSSSPDRGGDFLKEIWPDVKAATGANLITTYHTGITEDEMEAIYKKSQFWLHPCRGIELFCISGYKAQAAGCIPVVVNEQALQETVRFGVKTTIENYKEDLIRAINNPPSVPKMEYWDWMDVTKQLVELF